jgi:cobalt-zinc-cadmium efflux system outer membrane protein
VEHLPAELPENPAASGARAKALTGRSDLLASVAAYGAAEQALKLAVAEQYPDLRLSPGLLFDQGAKAWVLGAAAVLPLLNRNRGGIAQAKAQREIEGRRVLALQESVLHELEAARAGYGASLEALARAGAQEEARTLALAAAEAALRAGEEDQLAVALARAGLDSSRMDRLGAEAQAQAALGRIEDALQTPLLPAAPLPPLPSTAAVRGPEESTHEK